MILCNPTWRCANRVGQDADAELEEAIGRLLWSMQLVGDP